MSVPSVNQIGRPELSDSLEIHLMGMVDFESARFLQERLVYEISGRKDKQGGLLICEHPPLITVGREGSRAQILLDQDELDSRLLDVRWINRGNGAIVHAPGQLAVYPIIPLDRKGFGVLEYRRRLEQAVVDMAYNLKVPAERFDEKPGVWCRCGQFAQTGIAVKSWVSYHGLFINVCPSLDLQRVIQPLGLSNRLTSLSAQCVKPVEMNTVRSLLITHLTESLGYQQYHLFTGHPLLRRTKRKVHVSS